MTSVYDLMRQRCGLSQQEAADFHQTRLDTIKSWCSGRRQAPDGAIEELRDLHDKIHRAGATLALQVKQQKPKPDEEFIYTIGKPRSEQDAKQIGWPCENACLAAVGVAIAQLPKGKPIELVDHVAGKIPTAYGNDRRGF